MNRSVPTTWRKSSRSTDTSNCVEIALSQAAAVRDSKNTSGSVLTFPIGAWSAFVGVLG